MKIGLAAAAATLLSLAMPASPHRLDEYLQATILSVEKDHVQAFLRLTPGVAVCSAVLASIDTNADGVLSETEQRTYAERVIRDLLLTVDGNALRARLISVDFPPEQQMKEGFGEIQIEFRADLPHGGADRTLVFENHHQSRIAAYLVNCLVPRDRNIRIVAQHRNENQSFYQLDYAQAGNHSDPLPHTWLSGLPGSLGITAVLLLFMGMTVLWRQYRHYGASC